MVRAGVWKVEWSAAGAEQVFHSCPVVGSTLLCNRMTVKVTTPYGVIYDGIRPMDFDFDRWGRKAGAGCMDSGPAGQLSELNNWALFWHTNSTHIVGIWYNLHAPAKTGLAQAFMDAQDVGR